MPCVTQSKHTRQTLKSRYRRFGRSSCLPWSQRRTSFSPALFSRSDTEALSRPKSFPSSIATIASSVANLRSAHASKAVSCSLLPLQDQSSTSANATSRTLGPATVFRKVGLSIEFHAHLKARKAGPDDIPMLAPGARSPNHWPINYDRSMLLSRRVTISRTSVGSVTTTTGKDVLKEGMKAW